MDKAELANNIEDLVRGLVDQQAMQDDWWQKPLAEVLSAILDAPSEAEHDDTKRLNWLEETHSLVNFSNRGPHVCIGSFGENEHFHGETYRAAIDAAMSSPSALEGKE